ncbi:MAG: amino acid adenylation domain-containing protein [Nitrospinota bacterium]
MFGFEIPEDLKEKFDSFCKEQNCSPFQVLFALLQVLIFRYTSQNEFVLGTRTAPRFSSPKLIHYISRIDSSLTFKQILASTENLVLADSDSYSQETLIEALEMKDSGSTPLYKIILNVWDPSVLSRNVVLPDDLETSEPALVINLKEKEKIFSGTIGCSVELFDGEMLSRLADHFVNLLQSGMDEPEKPVSSLTLLSKEEHEKIVSQWNDTEASLPGDGIIHHWIEKVAKENPNSPAVEIAGETLTYSELDQRANRLANYLKTVNVGPDVCVRIFMSRSFECIVGILAILKAGGAYAPLDPAYPDERLQAIWDEMNSPILITQSDLKTRIDVGEIKTLCLDSDPTEFQSFSEAPPEIELTEKNLSYVIFTSGSTGKPKGILLTHGGLANLTHTSNRYFKVHRKTRMLQFSSFGFDVAVWEIFMALAAGGTLCLGTKKSLFSLLTLPKTLREEKITMALLPPSLLNVISSEGLDSLETVIAVGERCTNENVKKWAPGRNFFNGYGPAEGTVTVSAYLTNADEPPRPLGPPIGKPLENIEIYILDPFLNPVPVGVPGEMCLGGVCIARGYLNQEERTKEKFVPHPFKSGQMIYRTGDRARYMTNGDMEFLGRVDFQVKIRGYRVEPGEIEAVLNGCDGVQACTVLVNKHSNDQPYLVAYLVPFKDVTLETESILKTLVQKFPSYMVPSALVLLEKMPLTANGKVDRQSLPDPKPTDFQVVSGEGAPEWMRNFLSH